MIIQSDSIKMNAQRSYEERYSSNTVFSSWSNTTGATSSASVSNEYVYREGNQSSSSSDKKNNPKKDFKKETEDLFRRFQENQSVHGVGVKKQLKSLDELKQQSIDYLLYLLFGKKGEVPDTSLTKDVNMTPSGIGGSYTSSFYYSEQETTCFDARGTVITADGNSYSINISLEMSRSFTESTSTMIQYGAPQLCDPLVIQLSGTSVHLSDQKFFFDLDADGHAEEISSLAPGSGYLAYDKNGNGRIDDGSELFGTTSGNGFEDLAAYDDDHNGWIDEADEIFSKLLIWTKDASGNDVLCGLGKAGVGAIYLGSRDTNYSIKNKVTNETEAVIRKTGLFLYENGGVGTLQQLDLAI